MSDDLTADCPWCGLDNNAHEGPEAGDRPFPGAVSVCWSCGNLAIFDQNPLGGPLFLRRPDVDEARMLAGDPNVQAAVSAVNAVGRGTPDEAVENFRRNLS